MKFLTGKCSVLASIKNIYLLLSILMSAVSVFWSMPTMFLSGTAAATGIAFINSIGGLGGFISPEMFLWFKMNFDLGVGLMAAGVIIGIAAFILMLMGRK